MLNVESGSASAPWQRPVARARGVEGPHLRQKPSRLLQIGWPLPASAVRCFSRAPVTANGVQETPDRLPPGAAPGTFRTVTTA